MNIQYLKELKNNPIHARLPDYEIQGITESEISQLETTWNNGNPFPKALRELLFLAGEVCYVLDYNLNENQQEMQENMREDLLDDGITINRPFYAIDNYGGVSHYLFVYLDEGVEDPTLYEYSLKGGRVGLEDIDNLGYPMSTLINRRIEAVKQGRNPF